MKSKEKYYYNYSLANQVLKRNIGVSDLDYLHTNISNRLAMLFKSLPIVEIDHKERKITINGETPIEFSLDPAGSWQDYQTNLYYQLLKALKEDREQNYGIFTPIKSEE